MLLKELVRGQYKHFLRRRFSRPLSQLQPVQMRVAPIELHPEVQDALATNKPIVTLEAALVTDCFSYPVNLEVALSLENKVRSTGSIPVTIGMVGIRVKIGLREEDLLRLATRDGNSTKILRRSMTSAIAMKTDGGTTCSATMIFTTMAGIKVFATGGLGGVRRSGESSMDVSADLYELARCPVGLVPLGVRSILDIEKTLQYLGVPVLTYGCSHEFPAFFPHHSGLQVSWNVSDSATAAKILHTQCQFGIWNGALFAVPILIEIEEIGMSMQRADNQAVVESEESGLSRMGKEATPWLLTRVGELTQGKSRASSIALENNALISGRIAIEYQKLIGNPRTTQPTATPTTVNTNTLPSAELVIVGSSAIDVTAQAQDGTNNSLATHSTGPGKVSLSLGGVARNIAEASHRTITAHSPHLTSILVSPIGNDPFGRLLIEETMQIGMRVDGYIKGEGRTAVCNMVLGNDGGLIGGFADMDITRAMLGKEVLVHINAHRPRLVALDGNLSPQAIGIVVEYCNKNNIKVFFEPTSVIKSKVIIPAIDASINIGCTQAPITFSSPNTLELAQLFASAEALGLTSHPTWWQVIDNMSLNLAFRSEVDRLSRLNVSDEDPTKGTLAFLVDQGIAQMAVKLLPFFQHLIIKCGGQGVLVAARLSGSEAHMSPWRLKHSRPSQRYIVAHGISGDIVFLQHFPPHPIKEITNVTGAGDSFVGVLLVHLLQHPDTFWDPEKLKNAVFVSQRAAILSLQNHHAVSSLLSIS